MNSKLILCIFLVLNFACNSTKKLYNSGHVIIENKTELIDIEMIKNLAFCNVQINNKTYRFLLDTGAPTLISEEIFRELNLEVAFCGSVGDSQNNRRRQKFAILPQIKIDNIEFNDIGCIVMDIENEVLKCFNFDGIIGSNLLAKLYWKFDYQNNTISASTHLSDFEVEKFDHILNFKPKNQKTPLITGKIKENEVTFTFDTGFSGNLKVHYKQDIQNQLSSEDILITKLGANAIGIYGKDDAEKTYEMMLDLHLDGSFFENEIVSSGNSSLIGNKFLKDYIFVIDWMENKIYLKKNANISSKTADGFGFTYHFIDGNPKVVTIIDNFNIPLQLGDEILIMDETDFSKLENIDICEYILDSSDDFQSEMYLTILRNSDTLNYTLNRQIFIK